VEVQKRVEEGIERIMNAVDKRKDEVRLKVCLCGRKASNLFLLCLGGDQVQDRVDLL